MIKLQSYKARRGLAGGPLHSDPWSGWLTSYYQGETSGRVCTDIAHRERIETALRLC